MVPPNVLAELTGDLPGLQRRWEHSLRDESRRTVLAIAGGVVVGLCSAGPGRDADLAAVTELYALYVRASWHGTGLADRLIEPVIGGSAAYLWVADLNPRARRYYTRHGFAADGPGKENPEFGGIREVRMVRH